MFGVATNAILGQTDAYTNKECLAYASDDGEIW